MEFEDEGLNILSNNLDGLKATIDVLGNTLIEILQMINPNYNVVQMFEHTYARKFAQMTGINGNSNKSIGDILVTKYNRGVETEEWRVLGV
jgi:hypothetical protein